MNRVSFRLALAAATVALLAAGCDESPSGPDNSPLTEAEILSVAPPDFEVLLLAYDNVRAEHPDMDEESNAFGRLLLQEVQHLAGGEQDHLARDVAAAALPRLTRAEWLLIMTPTNWLKARPMEEIANEALALAAAEFPGPGLEDGIGDAFRHAYWNVRMAQRFGVEWARDWATAHESETPAGSIRTMDLNNNEVGRMLFSANPQASAATLAGLIKGYPLACMRENATFDSSRLLYVEDCPTVEVYDDGPDFDDVYEVTLGSTALGTTPSGGTRTFEMSNLISGTHALAVKCTVDGTHGGCGFRVRLARGLTFAGSGATTTPQQVVAQGASRSFSLVAPTLEQIRAQSQQSAAPVAAWSGPLPTGVRP